MNRIYLLFVMSLLSFSSFSQYGGFMGEHFFYRQPSARAEAMGGAYTATEGDMGSVLYNPAGISNIKGFSFSANYSNGIGLNPEAKFIVGGAGIKFSRYLKVGLNSNYYSAGSIYITDNNGTVIGFRKLQNFCNTLTVASEIFKDLHVGLNVNHLMVSYTTTRHSVFFDAGALKTFSIHPESNIRHFVRIGTGITNFTGSSISVDGYAAQALPIVQRLALSYELRIMNKKKSARSMIGILVHPEYNFLYNSNVYRTLKIGAELTFFDILIGRAGFSSYHPPTYNQSSNYSNVTKLSYGIGLQLPLESMTDGAVPLTIRLDYANLPQTQFNSSVDPVLVPRFKNSNNISFSLRYTFKKFK